jgi:catechol 2,3-dioxygenase-like lactoylglutathione lyase family enzyme
LGAKDEGAPGARGDGGFYGAYFRDPDGNKICVFKMG